MIEQIINIAFSGFWKFVGVYILFMGSIYLFVEMLVRMWSRFMRMLMVRKHGWPPAHLDADGDYQLLQ